MRKRILELKLLLVLATHSIIALEVYVQVHSQLLLLTERFQTDLQASTPCLSTEMSRQSLCEGQGILPKGLGFRKLPHVLSELVICERAAAEPGQAREYPKLLGTSRGTSSLRPPLLPSSHSLP